MAAGNEAILSNEKKFTVFQYDRYVIRFKAPYSLERYTKVKEWDHGYLVVMAKYVHNDKEEEEYIDLVPILENLYFDAEAFLAPIKKVRVADEADMIINGYAFTQSGEKCRVLNLRHPDKATVFSKNGEVLETSMDDIEIQIVKEYLEKNRKFMEGCNAEVL